MPEASTLLSPALNPADYPRCYRAAGGWAIFLTVIAILGLLSGVVAWYCVFLQPNATPAQRFVEGAVFGGLFLGGIYLFLLVLRFEITLRMDGIDVQSAVFSRRIDREDIRGWRYIDGGNSPPAISFTPMGSSQRPLQFPLMTRRDAAFESWLSSLPNLDEADLKTSQDEIANNEELGLTREERLATIPRAKRLAFALNAAGWASLFWSAAYPRPLPLMVLITAALPWFALYMVSQSKGVLRLDRPRKADPYHPHVAYALMMPGFGLTFRLMSDAHLLEWNHALWLSAAIALALWFAAIAIDRSLSTRRGTTLALLLPAIFYGYGAGIGFNTAFDPSPATVYSAQITRKYVVRGRHTDYNLVLAPWGPRPESSTVSVSYGYYNSVQPGDFVCLATRSGALHIAWYEVRSCR